MEGRQDSIAGVSSAAVFGAGGGIGTGLCEALARAGTETIYAGSRGPIEWADPQLVPFRFDLADENGMAAAARLMADRPPELVIVATGVLSLAGGRAPERSYRQLDAGTMMEVLAANTIGPALVAKHMLPLFPRDRRCVFAALSARVGSIGDNRLGGWHSYRASKAALNMLIRNLAIEMGRTHPAAIVVGLHPGTVDTPLSEPFQANLPEGQLKTAAKAASHLLGVLAGLQPSDSGGVFDWRGEAIPA